MVRMREDRECFQNFKILTGKPIEEVCLRIYGKTVLELFLKKFISMQKKKNRWNELRIWIIGVFVNVALKTPMICKPLIN